MQTENGLNQLCKVRYVCRVRAEHVACMSPLNINSINEHSYIRRPSTSCDALVCMVKAAALLVVSAMLVCALVCVRFENKEHHAPLSSSFTCTGTLPACLPVQKARDHKTQATTHSISNRCVFLYYRMLAQYMRMSNVMYVYAVG